MSCKIFVKWSNGVSEFHELDSALEFANEVKNKYNEIPYIYDEF